MPGNRQMIPKRVTVGQNGGFNPGSRPVRPMTRTEFVASRAFRRGARSCQQTTTTRRTVNESDAQQTNSGFGVTAGVYRPGFRAKEAGAKRQPQAAPQSGCGTKALCKRLSEGPRSAASQRVGLGWPCPESQRLAGSGEPGTQAGGGSLEREP